MRFSTLQSTATRQLRRTLDPRLRAQDTADDAPDLLEAERLRGRDAGSHGTVRAGETGPGCWATSFAALSEEDTASNSDACIWLLCFRQFRALRLCFKYKFSVRTQIRYRIFSRVLELTRF